MSRSHIARAGLRLIQRLSGLAAVAVVTGCLLLPRWMQIADEADLASRLVATARFEHRVLENRIPPSPYLRIFVEGDGTPWIRGVRIAVDPTPTAPLLLELMKSADYAAAYLGRPCYFGLATSRNCHPRLWTSERYGADVIASMCEAANAIARSRDATRVQLIGYSGGGTVVASMIGCVANLDRVTTLAANLDPAAWTSHHGYSPISDPPQRSTETAPEATIAEVHWQCRHDTNVPPAITDRYFVRHPAARRLFIDECSHDAGWSAYWPEIVGITQQNTGNVIAVEEARSQVPVGAHVTR